MSENSPFPGESFLQVKIPNYGEECSQLTMYLVLNAIFWFLVYPVLVSQEVAESDDNKDEDKTKASKKKKKQGEPIPTTRREVSFLANAFGLVGALMSSAAIILYGSPYNYFAPRRVFSFPLFTEEECAYIIEMANTAAAQNYKTAKAWANETTGSSDNRVQVDPNLVEAETTEQTYQTFLQEPVGWHKLRHGNYPTTDLNLITDPFTKDNREYLQDLFDKRLAPTLQRIYGIPASSVRAVDMFVVRYDAGIRTHLERHTDDGDVSFTILLNDEFEGGGTRFWKRLPYDQPFALVEPTKVGTVVTNHALVNHEGYHISKGTRYIFVGFTSVDRVDPWTDESTNLSWFASWFNLGWLNVKFKAGYYSNIERLERNYGQAEKWFDTEIVRLLFRDLCNLMEYLGDSLSPHKVEQLVTNEQADAYLKALDDAFEASNGPPEDNRANWWKGQMVNLDFSGKVDSLWNPRAENTNRFTEL